MSNWLGRLKTKNSRNKIGQIITENISLKKKKSFQGVENLLKMKVRPIIS